MLHALLGIGGAEALESHAKLTPSVRSALRDLNLDEILVVHAGRESYRLAAKVRAVAARQLVEEFAKPSRVTALPDQPAPIRPISRSSIRLRACQRS